MKLQQNNGWGGVQNSESGCTTSVAVAPSVASGYLVAQAACATGSHGCPAVAFFKNNLGDITILSRVAALGHTYTVYIA